MKYYRHHIIPLHEWRKRINPLAGRKDKDFNALDNIVDLTLEQHAQAHLLLFELNAYTEDFIAGRGLAGIIGHEEVVLEVCRMNGRNTKGRKQTTETKDRRRLAAIERWSRPGQREAQRVRNLGINNPCYGKPQSQESNKKRSATQTGIPKSEDHKKKIREAQIGVARPQTTGQLNGNFSHGRYTKAV